MESFAWDNCFDTGIPLVDEQHHRLFDLINRFGTVTVGAQGAGERDMAEAYAELAAYARQHFEDEEHLMAEAGLDERYRRAHKAEHDRFLPEIGRLRVRAGDAGRDGGDTAAHALLQFMSHWLTYHILGTDQAMAVQVARVAAGMAPRAAFQTSIRHADPATAALLRALDGLFHQVSARNRELHELNLSLEARVAERTLSLSRANQQLEDLAVTDVLTGLCNRRGALRLLRRAWEERADSSQPLACIMLDADGFKAVNDTFGHDAGDLVLQHLARQLKASVRTDDAVCRMGGDEFLVLCVNTPRDGALQIAEKLRREVAALRVPVGSACWEGRVSMGVAVAGPASTLSNVEGLLKAADEGLLLAKRKGRNRVELVETA